MFVFTLFLFSTPLVLAVDYTQCQPFGGAKSCTVGMDHKHKGLFLQLSFSLYVPPLLPASAAVGIPPQVTVFQGCS